MQKPNIPTKLQKWIGKHRHSLLSQHAKRIKKQIKDEFGITLTTQQIHDLIKPDNILKCDNAKFVGFAVGYRTCSKTCQCYKKRVSESVKLAKSFDTDEQKDAANKKRRETTQEKYNVDNVSQHNEVKRKIKDSFFSKYGVDNPMKVASIKEKSKQTLLDTYGVDNPMKVASIKDKNHTERDYHAASRIGIETKKERYGTSSYNNRTKAIQTSVSRYGTENPAQAKPIRRKISTSLKRSFIQRHLYKYQIELGQNYQPAQYNEVVCVDCGYSFNAKILNGKCTQCPNCFPIHYSDFETEFYNFLVENIDNQIKIKRNDRTILNGKEIDLLLPEYKIGIECNGLYWHVEEANKDRNYHRNKTILADRAGIKLIHIYSDEWKEKSDLIQSRLSYLLGKTDKTIYARQCQITQIDLSSAQEFLGHNHQDGYHKASFRAALIYADQIVAVMTFSKARYQQDGWEMIRFATQRHCNVVGGASRLFQYFIRTVDPTKVVTYSNNDWGFTEFYHRLGFTLDTLGSPSYFYIDRDRFVERINREHMQKHKLVEMGLDKTKTEFEIAKELGLSRVWTTGSSRWTWRKEKIIW